MYVAIKPITGGKFIADIGDDEMSAKACVDATFDMIDAEEVIYGYWYNPSRVAADQDKTPTAIRFERRGIAWVAEQRED